MTRAAQQRRDQQATARPIRNIRQGPRSGALPELVLPGERAVESHIVDSAVSDLNHIYTLKGLETARAVGEYVLARFFDNDLREFRRRSGRHISFRTLADREDLQFSYSFLWNSVAVVEQLRQMPPKIADSLSLSHHKLLLAVRDQDLKLRLAKRAVREKLSKRQLEGVIARAGGRKGVRKGRRPAHPLAKGLSKVRRALYWTLEQGCLDRIDELPPEEADRLAQALDKEMDSIRCLLDTLRRRCRRLPRPPAA